MQNFAKKFPIYFLILTNLLILLHSAPTILIMTIIHLKYKIMESYLFSAVACVMMIFIIGGLWFAIHDNEKLQPAFRPSHVPKYSPEDLDAMMVQHYYYTDDQTPLRKKLALVDTLDPKKRAINEMDHWFRRNTAQICHNAECLAYINHYGHLEDAFWKNIEDLGLKIEEDEVFQRLLISVMYSKHGEIYFTNFNNLLYRFGKLYSLMPKILHILGNDERLNAAKHTYETGRAHSSWS